MIDTAAFEQDGFVMVRAVLSEVEARALCADLEHTTQTRKGQGGVRDILDTHPALRDIALHPNVQLISKRILGPDAFLVRSILFDKTEASNWKVPWHQDITIAVREKRKTEGYGPWSTKAGIVHVQPHTQVLDRMLTVRVHLDPCPASNGALRVIPGSHQLGRLNQNLVEQYIYPATVHICEASVGEALVMRPLLLHTSSASSTPGHRRVLHFDFATGHLANGLEWRRKEWREAVGSNRGWNRDHLGADLLLLRLKPRLQPQERRLKVPKA